MSQIKLVLTDLDGTVAQLGQHIVSERVRKAVIACEEQGVHMVPVTGRFHEMAQPVLEVLGFEDLGIFDNGASIQNAKTGEVVWSKWLDADTIRETTRIIAPASVLLDYTPDHEVHSPADNEYERIDQMNESSSHVYGLLEASKVEEVTRQLAKVPGITFYTAASLRSEYPDHIGIQINHVQADKFHGVAALLEILKINKEHTLAIGDGDNDIPLFENAGLKIAMGNATDLLKAKADYVVGTVDTDGFAEAMERFVLI